MTFTSKETLIAYYKKYAKETGFAVIKRGIKKTEDIVYYLTLTCSREGKPRKSRADATKAAPTKTVPTTIRTECQARICAMLLDNGDWYLTKVVIEHNHALSPEKQGSSDAIRR
ncbi:hypothetical protein SLA2020_405130 [Shorea laevis]